MNNVELNRRTAMKTNVIPMRQCILTLVTVLVTVILWQVSSVASAANLLDLAKAPLFLLPKPNASNVFIELDDSGSMDWDIMMKPHWPACFYDEDYPGGTTNQSCYNLTDGKINDESIWYGYNPQKKSIDKFGYITDSIYNVRETDGDGNHFTNLCKGFLVYGESVQACTNFCKKNFDPKEGTPLGCASLYKGNKIIDAAETDWRLRSSALNGVYYNPRMTYKPWPRSGLPDASFKAAKNRPTNSPLSASEIVNLDGFVYEIWHDDKGYSGNSPQRGQGINATNVPNGEVDYWDSHTRVTVKDSGITAELFHCHTQGHKLYCKSETVDPPNFGRSLEDEKKNIANWYQYARRRMFFLKDAVGTLIDTYSNYRYGMSVTSYILEEPLSPEDRKGMEKDEEIEKFFKPLLPYDSTDEEIDNYNQALLNYLYKFRLTYAGTALRQALTKVGDYFEKGKQARDYYNHDPDYDKDPSPIAKECQRNYAILVTDGYWNDDFSAGGGVGDIDGDGSENTLADVAKENYKRDLDHDSTNNDKVPPTINDKATYQHLVTYTVGFGVKGLLEDVNLRDGWPDSIVKSAPDGPWVNIEDKEKSNKWGDLSPSSIDLGCSDECAEKIDDLWHAAYNSRGMFYSASSSEELVLSLQAILKEITAKTATVASVATSSSIIFNTKAGVQGFQALLDSYDWSGHLYSIPINSDGSQGSAVWDAGKVINEQQWGDRIIITSKPSGSKHVGIPFRWDSLTDTQKDALKIDLLAQNQEQTDETKAKQKAMARFEFIRGKGAADTDGNWLKEYNFRVRSSKLGDIVDSAPVYVGEPIFNYPAKLEAQDYNEFRKNNSSRKPIVYVGANDGMLHGFVASGSDGGKEVIAYVPDKLIGKLSLLTHPEYLTNSLHHYYVNGSPAVGDAFFANAWHTVLVGTLRGGGQSVFALDITNPGSFSEGQAQQIVLWEFNDAADSKYGDPDLGYTYSKPAIARMAGGQWVAVFGNGYNNTEEDGSASTTGNAVLYIVRLEDGQLLKKIDTGVGRNQAHDKKPNGLATPAVVDIDGDFAVDYIYAGDRLGNLWKFDVRGEESKWGVALNQPLFKAVDPNFNKKINPDGQPQPITMAPVVDSHPLGMGYMVYFGTGQYFETVDHNGSNQQPTQSLYGIWDKDMRNESGDLIPFSGENPQPKRSESESINNLLQQRIEEKEVSDFGLNLRLTSDEQINWIGDDKTKAHQGWYMDLSNKGERIVNELTLRNKRLIFNTLIPIEDDCSRGGTSWLMALDATDGSRLEETPFDLNGDHSFNEADLVTAVKDSGAEQKQPASGWQSRVGMGGRPTLITNGDKVNLVICGSTGACESRPPAINPGYEDTGRQSWRQLF